MTPKRRRSRLCDVAELAGTSVATASRALNRSGYIAQETMDKVLKAAHQLNYQPNLQARGLRQKNSRLVGLLIPNMQDAYYMALADSLSLIMIRHGYHLLVFSSRDDPEYEKKMLHDMAGRAIDGLFWVPSNLDKELVHYLNDQQIPTISLVRRVQDDLLDTVIFEDLIGSQKAVEHLISLGHRYIGFIGGTIRHSSYRDRLEGYMKAMSNADIPILNSLVKIGKTLDRWGEEATLELIEQDPKPTALFIGSCTLVPGVIKVLTDHNFHLPDDMSLVCFDDLEWFQYYTPSITAVSTNYEILAEEAARLFFRRIEDMETSTSKPILRRIEFNLMIRASSQPLIR